MTPKAKPFTAIGNMTVQCGISDEFHNKPSEEERKRLNFNSFKPMTVTLNQLVVHITSGGAYTPACFEGHKRTKATFKQAQLLGLDLDDNVSVADCLKHSFIAQYAFFVGATASSGKSDEHSNIVYKTRVLFYLDQPITNARQFERYQVALQQECADLRPDKSCKDASRLFFGSDNPDYVVLDNVLSLDTMETTAQQYDNGTSSVPLRTEADNQRLKQYNRQALSSISDHTQRRYLAYARQTLDNLAQELANTAEGGRNKTLFRCGAWMGNLVGAGMIDVSEIEEVLLNAGLQCGLSEHEVNITLSRAIDIGKETPFDLSQLEKNTQHDAEERCCRYCGQSIEHRNGNAKYCNDICKKAYHKQQSTIDTPMEIDDTLRPVNLAQPTQTVKLPYISGLKFDDLPDSKAIGILSPTGTGKTVFSSHWVNHIERILKQPARILVITHRVALSKNHANRLGFTYYKDVTNDTYGQHDKFVVCINSLFRLFDQHRQLPSYDAIIIDEPQHLLSHLLSETFHANEATNAYNILQYYLRNTPYLLLLDAHLSQTVVDIVSRIRQQPIPVIQNLHRQKRGTVKLYVHNGHTLDQLVRQAGNSHKFVIACETIKESESVYQYVSDNASKRVLLINSKTSSNADVMTFLDNPDEGFKHYDGIVHTSTIDSGVSFDSTQAVVGGLFTGAIHVASDINQMIARIRKPIQIHLFVAHNARNQDGNRPTNADAIYQHYLSKALDNQALVQLSGEGRWSLTEQHIELLKMYSELERDRNIQANNLLSYVVAYLRFDGFEVEWIQGHNDMVSQSLKDNADQQAEYMKQLRLDPKTPALTQAEFELLRDDPTYTLTAIDHAGAVKGKVLRMVGDVPYTEQLDKDLNTPKERHKLYNLTDLYLEDSHIQSYDIEDEDLLHKRHHRTLYRHLHLLAIQALFGVATIEDAIGIELPRSELEHRAAKFIDDNRRRLKHIGVDPDHYKFAFSCLREMLRSNVAIQFKNKHRIRTQGGKREYIKGIDEDHMKRWLGYKDSRLALSHENP